MKIVSLLMKIVRLPIQMIALLLQTYFIVETIHLYTRGYVTFMGTSVENVWFSLLFTLLVVVACEVVSFVDVVLFVASKHNVYSFIYLALFAINAICFMTLAYNSGFGTIFCMVLYAILFVLRIVNCVLNVMELVKTCKRTPARSSNNESTL